MDCGYARDVLLIVRLVFEAGWQIQRLLDSGVFDLWNGTNCRPASGAGIAALSVAYFHSYIALRWFQQDAMHPIEPLATWGFLD
jgi:hypothetical protein